ncbi:hypothetical protein NEMIN01_1745 [Nematocida minor]|uniref:uncharacterized protein n=1 Tax=Nematocida minor TaxID=1912983 RepID=UPI00221EFB42|nr:uncharacterized protein NEMIN01_1745 [Nematocida minor]KAI5191927.1 hypothetical protein NEMIN01_1745 [Nematocida minor]
MKKEIISVVTGCIVCLFVLWPIFLRRKHSEAPADDTNSINSSMRSYRRMPKSKQNRNMVGCIPIMNGKVFIVNGRHSDKFIFPKGGQEKNEKGYYSAGKEALEEVGVIGNIDKEPIFRMDNVDWYILEVTKVLPEWKERHERIRVLIDAENALLNAEVRAVTKNLIKAVIKKESVKKEPRVKNSKLVFDKMSKNTDSEVAI